MTEKLAARIRNSRTASTAALLLSFAVPFVWALSTGIIWDLGKQVPGSATDTAISFPTGLPLLAIVVAAWLAGFVAALRGIGPKRRIVPIANTVAVAAFCACFTWQFGAGDWNPKPDQGLTNIFPFRFAVAVALAYACSAVAARYLLPHAGHAPSPASMPGAA